MQRHDDDNTDWRSLRTSEPALTITEALIGFVCGLACMLMFAWVAINWLTGCGESFVTYGGEYIEGVCVFVPWVQP